MPTGGTTSAFVEALVVTGRGTLNRCVALELLNFSSLIDGDVQKVVNRYTEKMLRK